MLVAPLWKVPWRGLVSRERFPFLPTPSFKRTFKTNSHMRRQFKEKNWLFNKNGRQGSCADVLCFPSSTFSGTAFPWGRIWVRTCFHPGASGLARDDTGLEAGRKVIDFISLADLHFSTGSIGDRKRDGEGDGWTHMARWRTSNQKESRSGRKPSHWSKGPSPST